MLENLAGGLSQLDPDHAALYATNARLAREQLTQAYDLMKTSLELPLLSGTYHLPRRILDV